MIRETHQTVSFFFFHAPSFSFITLYLQSVGALCVVQCNDLGRAKVRAVVERFSENVVHVRHIDDGHMGTIQRNELWSIKNLVDFV